MNLFYILYTFYSFFIVNTSLFQKILKDKDINLMCMLLHFMLLY